MWISYDGKMYWEPFNLNEGNKTFVEKIRFGRNPILTSTLLATCKPARLVSWILFQHALW